MSDLTSILLGKELKTREKQKLALPCLKEFLDSSTEVFGTHDLARRVADHLMSDHQASDMPSEDLESAVTEKERLVSTLYYTAIRYAPYWTYARRSDEAVEIKGRDVYPWRFANPTTWTLVD